MGLETYRRKRDFDKTPEPAGRPAADGAPPGGGGWSYVIQKHAATRLHYDFRVELDGVLVSWAVPKGPSLDPKDKHLAVHVEDHPVEYGSFEGTIPRGEYGGGTVLLWDRGTWEPEGDPRRGLAAGELKFTLHGEKLRGGWVLARMKARSGEEGKDEWLLIKHRDEFAVDGDGQALLRERPESVGSGRVLEEIAAEAETSVWHGDRPADEQPDVRPAEDFRREPSRLPGAKKVRALPAIVRPELATLVDGPPSGEAWLHELKLDGYRALARLQGGAVRMLSRNGLDWTERYAPIAAELTRLPAESAILDGEVVVQLPDGITSFQALQADLGSGRTDRLLYYVFDLIHLDGYDLTGVAIEERKAVLKRLLARLGSGSLVRYVDDLRGEGALFYQEACGLGLEGIVSKKAGSPYRPGVRGREWVKVKCLHQEEFVIGGFTDPSGPSRLGFGALLLGTHDDQGRLRYVGKVGTGYSDRVLRELGARLRESETDAPPFQAGLDRAPKKAHWVRPDLVAQVAFTEWTRDGEIRHPSFKGLREDKEAGQVVKERAESVPAGGEGAPASSGASGGDADLEVRLTNPDRVFWPEEGLTKRDLVEYYRSVADRMLPFVLHRPVSMLRCPGGVAFGPREGQDSGCFFHKHAGPDFPGPFGRVEIRESGGPETYLTVTGPGSLSAFAQMGVLEIHIWGARWPDIERPDMMVFDLDPDPSVGFSGAVEGARLIRDLLRQLGLESFVKTTGGKGLHVVVPLKPGEDWDGVKGFSKAVADAIVTFAPDRYTSSMAKAKRPGKTFVDYLRNARSATSIAPYSTRAKPRAPVSVPLRWEELGRQEAADAYTVTTLARRLSRLKGDPWEGYLELQGSQTITEAMKREVGL